MLLASSDHVILSGLVPRPLPQLGTKHQGPRMTGTRATNGSEVRAVKSEKGGALAALANRCHYGAPGRDRRCTPDQIPVMDPFFQPVANWK